MKNLSNIMMCDFIDMMCGNMEAVKDDGEKVTPEQLKEHAARLAIDYKMLVNPSGMKSIVISRADSTRRLAKWQILRNCVVLLTINAVDDVVSILYGIGINVKGKPKEAISARVDSEMRRLHFERQRLDVKEEDDSEPLSNEQIRASFDNEIASLMAFFKMNIDIHVISASIYGNMVVIANREIEAIKQIGKSK